MSYRHHSRRSIRLPDYDYTQDGAYFITICTHRRAHLVGEVIDGAMQLNTWGCIADNCWRQIPEHFDHARLDDYVIMPNHMHGIVIIWRVSLAAQLLGTHHPHPREPESPTGLHPAQSSTLARGCVAS